MTPASEAIGALYPIWMSAVRDKDIEALERIVAPEFRYVDNIQGNKQRDVWMQAALSYEIVSFAFAGIEIADYGDTAAAFVHYRQEAKLRGQTRSGDWLITDLWRRNGALWQVAARSAILKPAG